MHVPMHANVGDKSDIFAVAGQMAAALFLLFDMLGTRPPTFGGQWERGLGFRVVHVPRSRVLHSACARGAPLLNRKTPMHVPSQAKVSDKSDV
jgi:hypothetical protein